MEKLIWIGAQAIYLIVAIRIFVFVIRHSGTWAHVLQKQLIEKAKLSIFSTPEQFEGEFFFYIAKIGIIFSSFVLLGMVYSLMFGPVVLG